MDTMASLLNDLKECAQNVSSSGSVDRAAIVLESILATLAQADEEKASFCEVLTKDGAVDSLTSLLEFCSDGLEKLEMRAKAAEVIAQMTKIESGRKRCSDQRLLAVLLPQLSLANDDVVKQTCRALGNICYDNDLGRAIIYDQHGVDETIKLLESCRVDATGKEQLRFVATGLMINLTNTYEPAQERALEIGIIDTLCAYLSQFSKEEEVVIHVLLIFSCLADADTGRQKIIGKNICSYLVGIVEDQMSAEVLESVLELVGNLAEDDEVKSQLAKSGLCEKLLTLLKCERSCEEEEAINITKMACDIIVLLLTGDESMRFLYDDGKGPIYRETLSWLESTEDSLQIAAALAVGNFARKDENCVHMVRDGVGERLLKILSRQNAKNGDIRLQHAVLSALRNLAIPAANKPALLKLGSMETILPMISIETFPVVFKLLGTLRMLIDGQAEAAKLMGQREDCISRLVDWCSTEDHPGVQGEANRLQAWLVKNSGCSRVMRTIVDKGGLPFLVAMTMSEHEVMQIEALLALTLICHTLLDVVEPIVIESHLSSNLLTLLSRDTTSQAVKCNTLAVIKATAKSEILRKRLQEEGILAEMRKLCESGNGSVAQEAKLAIALFESG